MLRTIHSLRVGILRNLFLVESSSAMFIEDPVIEREDSLVVEAPSSHSTKATSVPSVFSFPLLM